MKTIDILSYSQFEAMVKDLVTPKDFEENMEKVKDLKISSFFSFITILRSQASEIRPSIMVMKEIEKISIKTKLTEMDAIELINSFRFIISILDEKLYKK